MIVPVYREAALISGLIRHLRENAGEMSLEIIVVDALPGCETLRALEPNCADITLAVKKGRASQLNAGAGLAGAGVLLFLHADCRLPGQGLKLGLAVLSEGCAAASFRLGIAAEGAGYRIIESFANLRCRLERLPYGDQALFVRAEVFRGLGGFQEMEVLEDLDFVRRLKKSGHSLRLMPERILVSARRWQREGLVRCTLRNWLLRLLYALGVKPRTLGRLYPAEPEARS